MVFWSWQLHRVDIDEVWSNHSSDMPWQPLNTLTWLLVASHLLSRMMLWWRLAHFNKLMVRSWQLNRVDSGGVWLNYSSEKPGQPLKTLTSLFSAKHLLRRIRLWWRLTLLNKFMVTRSWQLHRTGKFMLDVCHIIFLTANSNSTCSTLVQKC